MISQHVLQRKLMDAQYVYSAQTRQKRINRMASPIKKVKHGKNKRKKKKVIRKKVNKQKNNARDTMVMIHVNVWLD